MTTYQPGLLHASYPAEQRRLGRIVLLVVVSLVCLAGAVGVVILAGQTGDTRGAALALLFATIPVPIVIGCFLWLDRYEPEPLRYLVAAVAWGGVIAVAMVLPVQLLIASRTDASDSTMAAIVAPLTEETAKGLFLLAIVLRRRRELTGVTDGLVYAGLVGIGFAFTENVGYYANIYAGTLSDEVSGPGAATGLFIVRGLFSPFSHSLFACAFGLGMGVALVTHRRWLRVVAPVTGLAVAIGLHALWNGSVVFGGPKNFLLVYALLFVPIFLGFVGFGSWARHHEGQVLVRALDDAAQRGWLHRDEIPWLSRFGLRRAALRHARRVVGKPTAKALKRYQSLATAMAFSHDRVLLGRAGSQGEARVQWQLAAMARVRPFILLPPPLRSLLAPPRVVGPGPGWRPAPAWGPPPPPATLPPNTPMSPPPGPGPLPPQNP